MPLQVSSFEIMFEELELHLLDYFLLEPL
jgi:hypothetical protein